MIKKKGYVHIYTGRGKGKTTASAGLALRASSHGWKVLYCYFFKQKTPDTGESNLLEQAGIDIKYFAPCRQGEIIDNSKIVKEQVLKGLNRILKLILNRNYDLVVLDEILIAVRDKIIDEETLVEIIKTGKGRTETVFTGRGATSKIIKEADLVSEVKCIKHPYREGIKARRGIEL